MNEHYYRLEIQIEKVQKEMLRLKALLLLQPDKQKEVMRAVNLLEDWRMSFKEAL